LEVATGREVRRFEGDSNTVESVTFSPNGHWALTGGNDGATRYFDVATGQLVATAVSFRARGWAVVDPEGRFDTSDLDGGAPLHWIASDDPLRPLPLEIFMRDYYTPRLLARILNGEKLPPIRPIAEIKNRVQPDVAVVSVKASKAHPERADVIVLSGHGYGSQDGQFYILPSDIQGTCAGADGRPLKNAISTDELAERLRPIDAGEMTFVLDSCDSASSAQASGFKPGPAAGY
jgi:WD40 repeat protein